MKIELDSSVTSSVLATLASEQTTARLLTAASESFEKDIIGYIEGGNSFTERTGNLKRSIGWKFNNNNESVITATAPYAYFVENGGYIFRNKKTRPYAFINADIPNRESKMVSAAQSVLTEIINERHN